MSHTDMREDVWRRFFPLRLHNILFALSLSGILAYSRVLAFYMLTNFDLINIRDVNNDDSFYYKIAQYLAAGFFSTFDGGITRTNGYHPIWLFLMTPIYWATDSESALFAIKATGSGRGISISESNGFCCALERPHEDFLGRTASTDPQRSRRSRSTFASTLSRRLAR